MKKDKQKWPIPLQFYELVSLYICKVFLYVWSLSKLSFQQIGDLEVVKIIGDKVGGWSETLIFHPPEAERAKGGSHIRIHSPARFHPSRCGWLFDVSQPQPSAKSRRPWLQVFGAAQHRMRLTLSAACHDQ